MNKKGNMIFWVIGIILVAFIAYLLLAGSMSNVKALGKSDMSHMFHSVIDPLAPDYFDAAQTNCASIGGVWKDSRSALGCFDIEEDFDTSVCDTEVGFIMQNICTGLGADWTCTKLNAGCEY